MTKKKKSGSTTDNQPKYNAKELRLAILDLLKNAPKKRYNPRQIAQTLSISNTKDAGDEGTFIPSNLDLFIYQSK